MCSIRYRDPNPSLEPESHLLLVLLELIMQALCCVVHMAQPDIPASRQTQFLPLLRVGAARVPHIG